MIARRAFQLGFAAAATDGATKRVSIVMCGSAARTTMLRGLNFDVTYDR